MAGTPLELSAAATPFSIPLVAERRRAGVPPVLDRLGRLPADDAARQVDKKLMLGLLGHEAEDAPAEIGPVLDAAVECLELDAGIAQRRDPAAELDRVEPAEPAAVIHDDAVEPARGAVRDHRLEAFTLFD